MPVDTNFCTSMKKIAYSWSSIPWSSSRNVWSRPWFAICHGYDLQENSTSRRCVYYMLEHSALAWRSFAHEWLPICGSNGILRNLALWPSAHGFQQLVDHPMHNYAPIIGAMCKHHSLTPTYLIHTMRAASVECIQHVHCRPKICMDLVTSTYYC
eukprot:TRINITY_DN3066_c0_g1_i1.p1 TRINITY_DN3066_c0_g1~~TRINITY_DN3066_c0_g1_i1.p1  ORF type:complete len:155 (+),score=0.13 TRINITY_DN3066_c0_g1_i1:294-758(+)